MTKVTEKNPTLEEMWDVANDVQYSVPTLTKAIYICACRDAFALPVGMSGKQLYQAVLGLPGVYLTAGIGKHILKRYLRVLLHQYLSPDGKDSGLLDGFAQHLTKRWYGSQIITTGEKKLIAFDSRSQFEMMDELLEWLVNDVQLGCPRFLVQGL